MVFTGSATEALNLALRGSEPGRSGKPVAVSAIEHSAVLNTALDLPGDTTILPVDRDGLVDPQVALPEGVGIVSVMQVNNEIGTVQPVADLYARARAEGALFVCDAVQAAGKIPVAEADMIAVSAHRFHGPKGVGCVVGARRRRVAADPDRRRAGERAALGYAEPGTVRGHGRGGASRA